MTDNTQNYRLNKSLFKTVNRYLIEKYNCKSHLNSKELEWYRTLLAINDDLAQNVLYHCRQPLDDFSDRMKVAHNNFLQDFNQFFILPEKAYLFCGNPHNQERYFRTYVYGRPMSTIKIRTEDCGLMVKQANRWRYVVRASLPYDYNTPEKRSEVFYFPCVVANKELKNNRKVAKCISFKIDKDKLDKYLTKKKIWGKQYKNQYDYGVDWTGPNHSMFSGFMKAAQLKTNNVDEMRVIKELLLPVRYDDAESFVIQNSYSIDQPENIKNVKLKFYQSSNVGWMLNIERNLKDFKVKYSKTVELARGVYVDSSTFSIHKTPINSTFISPSGGGLFDEVGLGKTLSMITLCASNPSDIQLPDVDKEKLMKQLPKSKTTSGKKTTNDTKPRCQAVLQSGKRKGEVCGCAINKPNPKKSKFTLAQLIEHKCCLRHAAKVIAAAKKKKSSPPKEPKGTHTSSKEKKEEIYIPPQFPTEDGRYLSRATLVVCPNQIPYQWRTQIEQYTQPVMKVVMITNVHEARKARCIDMIDADFIITTFNCLDRDTLCKRIYTPDKKTVETSCNHPPKKLPMLMSNSPQVCHYKFHRIIIDEVHEIVETKFRKMLPKLFEIKSNYKWCITGTPFKSTNLNLKMMLSWLYNSEYHPDYNGRRYSKMEITGSLIKKLFRRNTKESVQSVVPVKDTEGYDETKYESMLSEQKMWQSTSEEIVWMDLSHLEQSMYDARVATRPRWQALESDEYLRQICCSPTLNSDNSKLVGQLTQYANLPNRGHTNARNSALEVKNALVSNTQDLIKKMMMNEIPKRIQKSFANYALFKANSDKKTRLVFYGSVHHLKRAFFRLYQLKKSLQQFQKTPVQARYDRHGRRIAAPAKSAVVELFTCKGCFESVKVYNESGNHTEIDKVKSDMRYGVGECGHLFCGKCTFGTSEQKSQQTAERASKKRKTKSTPSCEIKKIGCMDTGCQCNRNAIGLYNALTISANINVENSEGKEEPKEERQISPPREHIQTSDGIPDYIKGTFRDELDCNINLYGTKVTHLIAYLRTYTTEPYNQRVILFSQYDNFLNSLKKTLTDFGMACVMCKGNVFQKRKATTHFKNDPKFRVILLSSKFSASGLDLIEANKIIFIDPVYGNAKSTHAIETQAIGRAHRLGQKNSIKIVRFLMRKTIEETAFTRYKRYVETLK